jgi:hypothetical protein
MRRLLVTCLVLLGVSLRAADEPAALLNDAPPAGSSCFLLVETSSAMKRQQDVALDTVNKLLLNSVNGRLRTNDALTIWAYSDRLHTNVLNDQPWDPNQRVDLANRIYRVLRDLSSSKKPVMAVAMDALRQATNHPGVLTAILVYSGSQPISGTPYDNLVNEITGKHRDEMREAGKPFITALVVRDGQYLGYGVTPGGRPVFLPPLPKPPPKPAVTNTPPPRASATVTNRPKPMTVEEIEEAIRKKPQPTNAALPATPPPTTATASSNAPAPAPAQATNLPVPSPAVLRAEPFRELTSSTPAAALMPSAPVTSPPATSTSASVVSPPVSPNTQATATPKEDKPAVTGVSVPPGPALSQVRSDPSARPAPPTAVVLPPDTAMRSWIDLVKGVVLLVAAAALAGVLIRNLRSRSQPSLISRSMDERPR